MWSNCWNSSLARRFASSMRSRGRAFFILDIRWRPLTAETILPAAGLLFFSIFSLGSSSLISFHSRVDWRDDSSSSTRSFNVWSFLSGLRFDARLAGAARRSFLRFFEGAIRDTAELQASKKNTGRHGRQAFDIALVHDVPPQAIGLQTTIPMLGSCRVIMSLTI